MLAGTFKGPIFLLSDGCMALSIAADDGDNQHRVKLGVRQLLGVPLSDAVLEVWQQHMVFDLEPVFLESAAEFEGLVLSRAEFNAWLRSQPLEFSDAFLPWQAKGDWVGLLSSVEFAGLDLVVQQQLNAAQVKANRGLVFPLEVARQCAVPDRFLTRDASADFFVLRFDAWWSLTPAQRVAWLEWYVTQDALEGFSGQWFANSGANCFAAALSAIEQNPTRAERLKTLWLQPETLQRELERKGYKRAVFRVPLEKSDVLVWLDQQKMVHAAAYIGNGLVVNKNSQAWYSPRQIVLLEVVLQSWNEPDLEIVVWRL